MLKKCCLYLLETPEFLMLDWNSDSRSENCRLTWFTRCLQVKHSAIIVFFSEQNTSYFYGKNEHILLTLFHNKKYLQVSHTKKRIWVTYLSCRISYESDCFSSTILLKLLDCEHWFSESDDRTCERMPTNKQHYFITCIKTESIRKLTNFNFQWTKTLYQNNLKNIAFFFTFFTG